MLLFSGETGALDGEVDIGMDALGYDPEARGIVRASDGLVYVALTGMPLSQTIYGFVLMLALLNGKVYDPTFMAANGGAIFSIGLACGLGELFSAWMQGVIGAAGVRAMSEADGKPFTFTIIAMGIAETVGLFACFFMFLMV